MQKGERHVKIVKTGLHWKAIGAAKPARGQELTDQKLAERLQLQTSFSEAEWADLGIKSLPMDHFIKSGDTYFTSSTDAYILTLVPIQPGAHQPAARLATMLKAGGAFAGPMTFETEAYASARACPRLPAPGWRAP